MFTDPVPSQSSNMSRKFRTLSTQFGDGYRQDTPDGINFKLDMWNINFENLTSATTANVKTFFDSVGSFDQFTWQAPGDSVIKNWKLDPKGYTMTAQAGNVYSISTSIYQVY